MYVSVSNAARKFETLKNIIDLQLGRILIDVSVKDFQKKNDVRFFFLSDTLSVFFFSSSKYTSVGDYREIFFRRMLRRRIWSAGDRKPCFILNLLN